MIGLIQFFPRNPAPAADDDFVIDVETDLAAAFGLSPLEGLRHSLSEEKHRQIDIRNAAAEQISSLRDRLSEEEEKYSQAVAAIDICERAEAMANADKLEAAE